TGEPIRWTTTLYDAVRRPVRTIHPGGTEIDTVYGDWSKTMYSERRVPTRHEYDADGKLVLTTEYAGDPVAGYAPYATTRSARDFRGRLVAVTDAEGNDTVLTYDSMNRRTAVNDPDTGAWSYAYDDAGRMIGQTDARGRVIAFDHDAIGRLTRKLSGT